ncbi:replicative DNA helicase [Bradyrhizobium oligotrophicum]|uniref:replicative DNA helicase n=1 Tax=Bradyrhizobium oligotrophicum TaxID=44255 RepID=UPI003EB85DB2
MNVQPRQPPHNIEAEQALLGAILLRNDLYGTISAALSPDDFFEPLHGHILYQAGQLITSGRSATPVTLKDAFPDIEVGQNVNLPQYLARLMAAGACLRIEIDTFISRVRDMASMRRMIELGESLARASDDGVQPEKAISEAWARIDEIRDGARHHGRRRGSIADLAPALLDPDTAQVVPTGLADLDRALAGGLRSGRLYILAGRPGMGKTVLGVSVARRAARRGGGVSIFSLEIDEREILARLSADELSHTDRPVSYADIVADKVQDADKGRVTEAIARLSKLPLRIDANGGLSMPEIEASARIDREIFAKINKRLGVVIVDYLGLVKVADRYRGNKVHELGEIALAGKTMAKRLDCAVVMLAQLNRSVESRDDKRPTMSDLRDSGNIEEHADFVGLLYRPLYYIQNSAGWRDQTPEAVEQAEHAANKLELIVGKNRLGPTNLIRLWCDPALSAVDNFSGYGR